MSGSAEQKTVVLAVVHTNSIVQTERPSILAAVVFYIVGAIADLFGRIYSQSKANTGGDDYGLSLVRLISTPLISGLAGIGGAFLYSMLMFQIIPGSSVSLISICNYSGAQAIGKGWPAKTAASAASMPCPCLRMVER